MLRREGLLSFLKAGDKVKVSVRFRGREMGHTEIGYEVLNNFSKLIEEVGTVEKAPKLEGRNMTMHLAPKLSNEGGKIMAKAKMKTHRGSAKRFKRTGTGKIRKI